MVKGKKYFKSKEEEVNCRDVVAEKGRKRSGSRILKGKESKKTIKKEKILLVEYLKSLSTKQIN